MTNTIQILSIEKTGKESSLQKEHNNKSIKIIDGYFFSTNLDDQKFTKISKLISNDVSQTILTKKNVNKVLSSYSNFNWVVEIKFLPGVTDNIATTVKEIIKDNLKSSFKSFELGSTKIILIKGRKEDITKISKNEANPLIQTIKIYPFKKFLNNFKKNQFKIEKVKLPKKKYRKKCSKKIFGTSFGRTRTKENSDNVSEFLPLENEKNVRPPNLSGALP